MLLIAATIRPALIHFTFYVKIESTISSGMAVLQLANVGVRIVHAGCLELKWANGKFNWQNVKSACDAEQQALPQVLYKCTAGCRQGMKFTTMKHWQNGCDEGRTFRGVYSTDTSTKRSYDRYDVKAGFKSASGGQTQLGVSMQMTKTTAGQQQSALTFNMTIKTMIDQDEE